MNILLYIVALWVAWLFLNGLLTGEVWVKGGAKDRFTRSLDMHSFAHKVSKNDNSFTYWIILVFYFVITIFLIWIAYTKNY